MLIRDLIVWTLVPLGIMIDILLNTFCLSASFGMAGVNDAEAKDLEGLFKQADQALYQAKSAGRNKGAGLTWKKLLRADDTGEFFPITVRTSI